MTDRERRAGVEELRAWVSRVDPGDPGAGAVSFLLAELDAACAALHDLRQDSAAYRRGFEDGVEHVVAGLERVADGLGTSPVEG